MREYDIITRKGWGGVARALAILGTGAVLAACSTLAAAILVWLIPNTTEV